MSFGTMIGRILLALIFIGAGVDILIKGPQGNASFLKARYPVFHQHAEKLIKQQLPDILSPQSIKLHSNTIVQVAAAVEIIGGILVILNSSFGAFLLQIFVIQTILIIHNPFLFNSTPQEEEAELVHMLKNLAILGGLMLVGQKSIKQVPQNENSVKGTMKGKND